MRRGLLIIDRGSREQEARDELEAICAGIRSRGAYEHVGYCFLEVVPPFIPEGIADSVRRGIDSLTIVPYFLYPGRKVKAAVTDAMGLQSSTDVRFVVSRPMSMHPTMTELVRSRVSAALDEGDLDMPESEVDVLLVCHGSKDPNAKMSIRYIMDGLEPVYKSTDYCFLEIEEPNISQGIAACEARDPEALVIVFYFLHEGAHVKRDIYEDLNPALEGSGMRRVLVTRHIGADERMIDLIVSRAAEAEDANA